MKHLISITCVVCVVILSAPAAYSCDCTVPKLRRDYREATAIFVGKVVEVRFNQSSDDKTRRLHPMAVKLKVEKSWKGVRSPEITVITNEAITVCGGFEFREGERYIIYAYEKDLVTFNSCSRSRPLNYEDEFDAKEIKRLNSFWFRLMAQLNPF